MQGDDRLINSLRDVQELETFLHRLLGGLTQQDIRHGEDVSAQAKEMGIEVPELLSGMELTWDTKHEFERELGDQEPLVLVRPGHPDALGFTIGCIRISRRIKVCLECGWLYCKIVIKGTF